MLTLVINLSLSTVKAIVINDGGKKVFHDWLPVRTSINGSSVEQDPKEWWSLTMELLQKIFGNKELSSDIDYITVTSSALCLVALDNNGTVLDKAYMVSDKRAESEAIELKNKFPEIFKENPAFKADASFMLPKVLWIRRNKKEIFKKTAKYLSSNDYLVYKLTGKYITDSLNAEKFYFDTKKNLYPKKILNFVGISSFQLPKVVLPGTLISELSDGIKKKLAIKHSVKLSIGTYDAICAFIGSSTFEDGELNNVCGTCSSYRMYINKSEFNKNNLLQQYLPGEDMSIVGGSNNLEGGVLEWAKGCFYGDSFMKDDNFLYDLIQKEAKESELGANGVIFLPYLIGERLPFSDPDVRGMFFGIERFHKRPDMIRSVFEAMAFQARLMLEEFEKSGMEVSVVNMSGGGAKMEFAAQVRSDMLGLPVNVLSEVETTAKGAFIFTLKARRIIKSIRDGKKFVKIEKRFIPKMHNHNCYSSLFILYKQLYTTNSEVFRKRRELLDKMTHYRKNVLENL